MSCAVTLRDLTLDHTIPTLTDPEKEDFFKKIVRKGENTSIQYFLLSPQCFLPFHRQKSSF